MMESDARHVSKAKRDPVNSCLNFFSTSSLLFQPAETPIHDTSTVMTGHRTGHLHRSMPRQMTGSVGHDGVGKCFGRLILNSSSVSLCLCGDTYLFPWRIHKPNPIPRAIRHGLALVALLLLTAMPALAVEPSEQLKNPALEARARELSAGLRCLVCQNETIDESSASLAHDIRMLLRERLTAGDTDEQAVKAIVDRYGEFVLLDPPVRPATYVLWFGPAAVLLGGLLGGAIWLRRRSAATDSAVPLSADERSRLDAIMREADR
jgi:cytochrome c-type biogenesis protein CcmH